MIATYRLVFDLSAQPFRVPPDFPTLSAIAVGAGVILLASTAVRRWRPGPHGASRIRPYAWIALAAASIFLVLNVGLPIGETVSLREAQVSRRTSPDEGCLSAFHPEPAGGHDPERFMLNGRCYSYSYWHRTSALHLTEGHGGPIHSDSRVRLLHLGPSIVRLEVADHACPAVRDLPAECP